MLSFFRTAFIAIVFLASMLSANVTPVHAQEKDTLLFVSPQRLTIKNNTKAESVLVANKSKESKRYDLVMVDQVMNEQGLTQRQSEFEYSAKRILRFVPKRFTLKPGERQTVRVMVRRPKDLKDGDYHSHLLFREIPLTETDKQQLQDERKEVKEKAVSFEIKTRYGLAIPVVVQHGKVESDVNFGEASLSVMNDPQSSTLIPQLNISFNRSGNAEAAGLFHADYVYNGKTVENIVRAQWIRMYREIDHVYKHYSLNTLPEGVDITKGKIVMTLVKKDAGDKEITLTKEVSLQ